MDTGRIRRKAFISPANVYRKKEPRNAAGPGVDFHSNFNVLRRGYFDGGSSTWSIT